MATSAPAASPIRSNIIYIHIYIYTHIKIKINKYTYISLYTPWRVDDGHVCARRVSDPIGGAPNLSVKKEKQVTHTRTRQQNKPLTQTQSEQRRNDDY